jgi:hypothetical protein
MRRTVTSPAAELGADFRLENACLEAPEKQPRTSATFEAVGVVVGSGCLDTVSRVRLVGIGRQPAWQRYASARLDCSHRWVPSGRHQLVFVPGCHFDDDEYIDQLEGCRHDNKEVTGDDRFN